MDAQGQNTAPISARLEGLLVRLARLLSDPTASNEDVDFGMFLLANSGVAAEPGTESAVLRDVYVPFWTSLIQMAVKYPDVVARLPWPPTPSTAYRHATHDIYSGKYRPSISGVLEEWSPLRVPSTGGVPAEAASLATDRIAESIETARKRGGTVEPVIGRPAKPMRAPQVQRAARPPPNNAQIYEAIRQKWSRLTHAYDDESHPTIVVNVNTPRAVLRMLEADGFDFRREGNFLIMH
ncbi:hypothetical protein pqer_cds_699 [Pandoravirus quercus]|uniref:DUF5848 domain-containing protein n=2 Tax=Pandoravirus TaxID=2060084 RepID=A0A2U7U9K0_9VIRU|nr:hypothetical protein pqer_cds_699 [Pandoravirus quercus]AVK75121.1 hypothetical protein pqer_cds_699 [Pandoravirus quercus]QBZ81284.1 hypothetical protein pclt_cds_698 [Pandoravirus celtis]